MAAPHNAFKQALRRAEPQIGLWLGLADPYTAELCATAGFDWLLVDGEHGPNDLRSMLGALQAIAAYDTQPVVRLPQGDAALIKQVLEIGATTLLIPMVENAEQARALVQAVRYPPQGIRGVGSGLARSSRWGADRDYLRTANDRTCLLVQVETAAAVAQVEAIAAIDGIDGVFIGPADLSASMGYLGQPAHPEVRAAIDKAIGQILAAGKAPGILCVDEALARHYIALGARFVAVGVDATLLAQAASGLAGRFRSSGSAAATTDARPAATGY
ncbi:4-hydroxy-2-oxoheptanedioate aldolase [Paracidovorax cattleyae]|uniref:2,4-dihydroxyhept-2-enedioate aldolase n=1 Tax=Paracidovorax cattleyae TaxID=80868 RepID=A0A1H0WBG4_9BURK|nr:4-hydroxy-2-oxoheptanedioate aldolase [Paracidovorax cattleyae]AVS74914.1 4-hydroxy-2-oxoheptanedioate aldolase [Paracidovorax cattleyae]SDP87958.1 2,4-dihydroxyhept-2-enedioate aldolase [Paracidovorax cattleyae]